MSAVRDLHRQAMTLSNEARNLRMSGNQDRAREVAERALSLEREAAERIPNTPGSEPTRSILYRSAASLAYQAGDFQAAQRLVFEGLAGYPSPRVEQELKDLYEQLNFATHLKVRGAELGVGQMQLALVGDDVGSGQMIYTAFEDRARALITMLDRTMRRLMHEAYRAVSRGSYQSRPFIPLLAAPRVGSFAVTIEVAQRKDVPMSYLTTGDEVIDQVITGIGLVQEQRFEELHLQINDEKYFVNFVSLAQRLAPDGERVRMVGLTSPRNEVSFTAPKVTIPIPAERDGFRRGIVVESMRELDRATRTYRGVLDQATVRNNADTVGLMIDDENRTVDLRVREGMDDLVRSYFNRHVEVAVDGSNKSLTLRTIREIDEE